MPTLIQSFQTYLKTQTRLSPASIKNYLSDLNFFLGFVKTSFQQQDLKLAHLSPATFSSYRQHLVDQLNSADSGSAAGSAAGSTSGSTPGSAAGSADSGSASGLSLATANRRLSALRHFGAFLKQTNLLDTNPALALPNLDALNLKSQPAAITLTQRQILRHYSRFLKHEKLSSSTIKNYLSDLNQYLLWAQKTYKTTENKLSSRSS